MTASDQIALRQVALAQALQFAGSCGNPCRVVDAAEVFYAYLVGEKSAGKLQTN